MQTERERSSASMLDEERPKRVRKRTDKHRAAWKQPFLVRKADKRLAAIMRRKRAAYKATPLMRTIHEEEHVPIEWHATPTLVANDDGDWHTVDPNTASVKDGRWYRYVRGLFAWLWHR